MKKLVWLKEHLQEQSRNFFEKYPSTIVQKKDFVAFYRLILEQRAYAVAETELLKYFGNAELIPTLYPAYDTKVTYEAYAAKQLQEQKEIFKELYVLPVKSFLKRLRRG